MNKHTMTSPGSAAKRIGAAALSLQILAASSAPSWAQRRQLEPDGNSQSTQTQVSADADRGAPISDDEFVKPAKTTANVQIGALPKPSPTVAAPTSPLETRVTVRVKGAPLATFLETVSAQSKINFIIAEGLENKRVTAYLQNVTVREALQVLLEIRGLTYQQIGKSNTYLVTPRSNKVHMITRVYTLSYIPLIALTSLNAEQASITPFSTSGGGVSNNAMGGQQAGQSQQKVNADIGIIKVIESVLTPKMGMVEIEPRTNSLVVTDIPEVFPQVEQIIAELDKKAPQIMIEAQIVEIDSTRARDLGLEWGGANGELASFTGGARDTTFPMGIASPLRFFDPVVNIVSQVASLGGGGSSSSSGGSQGLTLKTSIVDLTQLSVILRALVSRSEARFLGKPKIMTLNNKPALIQIVTNQAVSVSQSISGGGNGISQASVTVERVATGLVLKVIPQVNKEGYITMLVQPSFGDAQPSAISRPGTPIFDPTTRGGSSLVRVKNSQTLVLGGLLQSSESKVTRKVPLLGYIPLIGWLFTSTSTRRRNSDLVIFLTPTIVND